MRCSRKVLDGEIDKDLMGIFIPVILGPNDMREDCLFFPRLCPIRAVRSSKHGLQLTGKVDIEPTEYGQAVKIMDFTVVGRLGGIVMYMH